MSVLFSNIVSFVFHPVFMPIYTLMLIFTVNPYLSAATPYPIKKIIFGIVVLSTIIFPLLITWMLKKANYLKSFQMERKEERILPFGLTAVFYFLGFLALHNLQLPAVFVALLFGATLVVITTTLVTIFWKISIHLAGMGGITGSLLILNEYFVFDLFYPLMTLIIITGVVGTARLIAGKHTSGQIYMGFAVGIIGEILVMSF